MYSTDTATSKKPQLFSSPRRSCVHASVRVVLIAGLIAAAAGCGRTALEPRWDDSTADAGKDAPRDLPAEKKDAPPDMPPDLPPDVPNCVPRGDEECNGIDDDCNGLVDDGLLAIPCPNGGSRICLGGKLTECSKRCQICMAGSERTCITSFCTFWGSQTCNQDGMGFGSCKESQPPAVCKKIADKMMRSPELEKCCIENGFCCVDEFDLNGNGDTKEMLGRCDSIVCE